MFASTQVFEALPLSPGRPSAVSRWSETPLTVTFVAALITVTPMLGDVIWTVHEPVEPIVVQVLTPPTKVDGPDTLVKVISVPAGAFANPLPSLTFTCPVSVWLVPIGLTADGGVIWMFASTIEKGSQALTAESVWFAS